MKHKSALVLFAGVLFVLFYNSCKKETQSSIQALFTNGSWELASVQVYKYTGNTQDTTYSENDSCKYSQFFTFTGNSCTYTNFECMPQPTATGTWSLTQNQLFLNANMVCKDTTAVGSSTPFANAQILNLGQYSLVLRVGDIAPNYSLTAKRTIVQFGFIRVKSTAVTQ